MSAIQKKTEYYVVNASKMEDMTREVNEKLSEGWELYGDVQFNKNSVGVVSYVQALTKTTHYGN